MKTAILIGESTVGVLESADRKAVTVVATTGSAIGTSMEKSAGRTEHSLNHADRAFLRAMGPLVPKTAK